MIELKYINIYVVLDKDNETTLVLAEDGGDAREEVIEEVIEEFVFQFKRGNAFFEIWRDGNCIYNTSYRELGETFWKEEIKHQLEEHSKWE